MPAPSASTNPSRSRSNGRLALVGASLRVLSAFIAAKLPTQSGVTAPSLPPATTASASPRWIMWNAAPMAWLPVAHAVAVAMFAPRRPKRMLTLPARAFTISLGTTNGLTVRGPFSMSLRRPTSMVSMPPMPLPMATP